MSAPSLTPDRPAKIYHGWWIVLTAALGLGLGFAPIVIYSFGVFLKPLLQEFHSNRASISLAFTFANLAQACAAAVAGRLTDRIGARTVIVFGTAIFGSLLVLIFLLPSDLYVLYFAFILLGFTGVGAAPVPYGRIVSNWFDQRRGLALGLTLVGLGLGAIAMPSLAQRLISVWGWRAAYAILGVLVIIVTVPIISVFLQESPQKLGLPSAGSEDGITWKQARRGKTFWMMAAAFFLLGGAVHGCSVHLPAMLTDRGVSPAQAAMASSVVGFAVLIGRGVSGYCLDRIFAPYVALFFFSAATAGIALLLSGTPGAPALLAAGFVGIAMGAEVDIIAYMTSRYFGLRAFGEIYGYAFANFAVAGALGPVLMGFGFDHTGSYKTVLLGFLAATVSASVAILRLGPYRYRPH